MKTYLVDFKNSVKTNHYVGLFSQKEVLLTLAALVIFLLIVALCA